MSKHNHCGPVFSPRLMSVQASKVYCTRYSIICCVSKHTGIRCTCLDVGACLKVNTRALGRGALHKKVDSIPLLLTSKEIGLL